MVIKQNLHKSWGTIWTEFIDSLRLQHLTDQAIISLIYYIYSIADPVVLQKKQTNESKKGKAIFFAVMKLYM